MTNEQRVLWLIRKYPRQDIKSKGKQYMTGSQLRVVLNILLFAGKIKPVGSGYEVPAPKIVS